jgi:hypothetical protein
MKEGLAKIFNFFKNELVPNLPYYLLQIFLVVVMVLIFAGINLAVRMLTDPICIKVLRMKEHKRGPGFVGLVISAIIMAILLMWSYATFPQLKPTIIGWTGHHLQILLNKHDRLPDLTPAPAEHAAPPKPAEVTATPVATPAHHVHHAVHHPAPGAAHGPP